MDSYDLFKQHVANAVDKFRAIEKNSTIRVVSHLDADGISACAVLINALNKENRKYAISILPQLDSAAIKNIAKENHGCYFFTDLGSGQISLMEENFGEKKIFILDHHTPEKKQAKANIVHVNPHLFGIDGGREISGAGVVYLFAEKLNPANAEMSHIPIIGALGDLQENQGFLKLNNEILEIAKKQSLIDVKRGLRFFGAQTKPLHKILEYSTDPYIPEVSGSESKAIQFLNQLGINPKKGNDWKMLSDLSEDEMKKLVAAVVMKRLGEDNPEDIIGYIYTLKNEKTGSPLKDAKEFATLLNACGRLNKASLGIGTCLGDEKIIKKAFAALSDYKKEIIKAMKWFKENENSEMVIKGKNFMIINAEDNVMATIIGTLASIISKSNTFEDGTLILSMAQAMDNTTKISLRLSGNRKQKVDLQEIISEIISKTNYGQAGGHYNAAGAIIPTEKEKEFIELAKEVLDKRGIEEKVM